ELRQGGQRRVGLAVEGALLLAAQVLDDGLLEVLQRAVEPVRLPADAGQELPGHLPGRGLVGPGGRARGAEGRQGEEGDISIPHGPPLCSRKIAGGRYWAGISRSRTGRWARVCGSRRSRIRALHSSGRPLSSSAFS